MTVTTITAIVLAFFLGFAVMVALRHACIAGKLRTKNTNLRNALGRYKEADCDEKATYTVKRIDTLNENINPEIWGEWAVVRVTIVNGYIHHTLIKVFTDEDDEFNKNEADELCDKLNEK